MTKINLSKIKLKMALKSQSQYRYGGFSVNDLYNMAHFKTDMKHAAIVAACRLSETFNGSKTVTQKQLDEFLHGRYEVSWEE